MSRPTVVTVVDSQGKMVPDRVRVSWGRLENFKCVDYFQIEYYEKDDRVCMISATSIQTNFSLYIFRRILLRY